MLCGADTKVRGRFSETRYGPSRRCPRNASGALENFTCCPQKTFSTASVKTGSRRRFASLPLCPRVWTAPGWQELSSRMQHWSVRPCVRPFGAVHMTAGHNALRGPGPDQKPAFDNARGQLGCPDRRIDRLCITCCSPSQPSHHAGCPARSRYAASATGSLYRSPLTMMAQTIRAILLASAMAATLVGRRASRAVSQGRCLVPWILA